MYRPIPEFLIVDRSYIEGRGIITLRKLAKGMQLGLSHIYDEDFPDNLIRTPLGGFINHSDKPNCQLIRLGRFLFVEVLKDIEPDTEITLKYGRTKTLFE